LDASKGYQFRKTKKIQRRKIREKEKPTRETIVCSIWSDTGTPLVVPRPRVIISQKEGMFGRREAKRLMGPLRRVGENNWGTQSKNIQELGERGGVSQERGRPKARERSNHTTGKEGKRCVKRGPLKMKEVQQ